MFKPSIILADVIEPECSRTMRVRTIIWIAIGVLLVPLAAEAALLCYSQWSEVLGASTEVQTPILDSIGQSVADTRDSLAEALGPTWSAVMHDPYVALPLAAIFIVVAMTLLKW